MGHGAHLGGEACNELVTSSHSFAHSELLDSAVPPGPLLSPSATGPDSTHSKHVRLVDSVVWPTLTELDRHELRFSTTGLVSSHSAPQPFGQARWH